MHFEMAVTLIFFQLFVVSLINNWMVPKSWGLGASGVGSKVWVLTIGVLEVIPERDSIRAQRGRARSALFCRVHYYFLIIYFL